MPNLHASTSRPRYCEQSDIHSPGTTVEEALWTSARLRLPASVGNKQVGCGQTCWLASS
jgi:hypothetical protein